MAKTKKTSKPSPFHGAPLCYAHAEAEGLAPGEYESVPHHSELESEDDVVPCALCTVAIMRRLGAL